LTEHFAGAFPLWLAPVQIAVLPITDRVREYSVGIADKLTALGFRVETDNRNEKIGYKIREAQLQKIPYMLVLGDKEAENGEVTVRSRSKGDLGAQSLDEFIAAVISERDSKAF
jgi:threonyl-tRNA synthetase